jgi:hypothetical protein
MKGSMADTLADLVGYVGDGQGVALQCQGLVWSVQSIPWHVWYFNSRYITLSSLKVLPFPMWDITRRVLGS